ncbi:hypothetical protein AB0K18_48365 [Nonomuraea sp. NPDC049421]|uniref:hypothetical protein n=1 Tax=Nonomuraea sp. NPDC049421 TaxID=3155275 RepID=UPI00344270E2
MNGRRLGLSSGSLPDAGAAELAAATARAGGGTVDLRTGKGHAWERDGVARGIRQVTAAGVEVAFVGCGARAGRTEIGRGARAGETEVGRGARAGETGVGRGGGAGLELPVTGHPVKVFCVPEPDPATLAGQVRAAADQGVALWVETHQGGPSCRRLAQLAEVTGIGVVVDLLGVAATGGADAATLARLAPHVRAVQVKGFRRDAGGAYRHRALRAADLEPVEALLSSGAPIRAITVESRAGTAVDDLRMLAKWEAR